MAAKRKRIISNEKLVSFVSLFNESDRGCVVLATSIFDHHLRLIHCVELAALLKTNKKAKRSYNPDKWDFNDKINKAFGRNLISSELKDSLHAIRKLRNEIGHGIHRFTLSDKGVQTHLEQLKECDGKLDQDRLMIFEDIIDKLKLDTKEEKLKFHFVMCCHVILEELRDVFGERLERL